MKSSLEALKSARDGVSRALQDVVNTVVKLGTETLSKMHDRELGTLLTEAARARSTEAIVLIAGSMKSTSNMQLTVEEAEVMLGIGYNMPPEAFLTEGKNTNMTNLLISAVQKAPKADGANEAMRRLVRAKVNTSQFLNRALSSGMQMSDKMAALDLADKVVDVTEETIDALMAHLLRAIENGAPNAEYVANVHELVVRNRGAGAGEDLVRKLVSHRDCAYAAAVVKAFPRAFDAACSAVLSSGSPESIAIFWQEHEAKCDKKAFHEKLTEALRPDPAALAAAILDRKRGRYPMMHPMMFFGRPGAFMREGW